MDGTNVYVPQNALVEMLKAASRTFAFREVKGRSEAIALRECFLTPLQLAPQQGPRKSMPKNQPILNAE